MRYSVRMGPTAVPINTIRARAWHTSRLGQHHLAMWPALRTASPALGGPCQRPMYQPLWGLRTFILAGAASIVVAVVIIGHSADIGWLFGDRGQKKMRAIVAFVFGFWLLDVASNMTQGPRRALLADLTGKDHRRTRVANAYFSLIMAVGNVLGFATGSYSNWFKIFPFTLTSACNVNCTNLKAAFVVDIIFILITAYISLSAANEQPQTFNFIAPRSDYEMSQGSSEHEAFLWEFFGTFRYLPGLSMGGLNLAIVVPQVIISLGAGPWDQLFGGGNSPALLVAAISKFASGLIAIFAIPQTRVGKSRIQH